MRPIPGRGGERGRVPGPSDTPDAWAARPGGSPRTGDALVARHKSWALLQRVADGDDEALREIYRAHRGPAFALAVRMLGREDAAEEVLRETFLHVWRDASRLHPGKADLPTWLGQIVRELCVARLRGKQSRLRGDTVHDVARWLAPVTGVDSGAHSGRVVREVFLRLPREQSDVLTLAYFEGLTHREIAQALAIPEAAVTSRMRAALHRLRANLDGSASRELGGAPRGPRRRERPGRR